MENELRKDMELMEDVAVDLFGQQQVRWRHTKLTRKFNSILERNSKILIKRADELRDLLKSTTDAKGEES